MIVELFLLFISARFFSYLTPFSRGNACPTDSSGFVL